MQIYKGGAEKEPEKIKKEVQARDSAEIKSQTRQGCNDFLYRECTK